MDDGQVQSRGGVTLVGAGHPRPQDIEEALKLAPLLVAADGGADHAIAAGFTPERVIGDLDSLGETSRRDLAAEKLVFVDDQNSTDFEKALERIDAPFVIATGFTSGRVDHLLAVCRSLARRIGPRTLVLGAEDVIFAAPRTLSLDVAPGTRVSLFPMAAVTGRSEGLEWPIDGLAFHPSGQIGTSNIATGPVRMEFDGPGMLVIMPREALAASLAALTG